MKHRRGKGFVQGMLLLALTIAAPALFGGAFPEGKEMPRYIAAAPAENEAEVDAPVAPGMLTGLKAAGSGKGRVSLTWNEVPGAEGYLVYGKRGGSGAYGYIGMTTQGAVFHDAKAIYGDYNYYWVFAYVKDSTGKMLTGKCEKYVFAKGICPAAEGLQAKKVYGGVKLTFKACSGAEGYLVYGKTESGKYGFKGMTDKTEWIDYAASYEEWNFYWVFPYFRDAAGKMITGPTGPYTYGKAEAYNVSVTGLKAEGQEMSVRLTWDKVADADGYLVYRKIGNGDFEYRYMVTEPQFLDTTASITEFNFYRVYPYVMTGNKRIVGTSTAYVYSKALERKNIVAVSGLRRYDYAYQVLELVNEERAKADLSPLSMDEELMEAAMLRAAEITIFFEHTRPNGTAWSTVSSKAYGENIAAGYPSPADVMMGWMNSPGHRGNIMGENFASVYFKSIGIGCLEKDGRLYWVQLFGVNMPDAFDRPANQFVTEQVEVALP